MSRPWAIVGVTLGLAVSATAQTTPPQSPFKPPSNLLVLPKDTKLSAIVPIMKGFTQALGVRCQFCHTYSGSDPDALENFDFPSDALPTKATARKMMALLQTNEELLKSIGEPAPAGQPKVTCYTCHRGARVPLTSAPPR